MKVFATFSFLALLFGETNAQTGGPFDHTTSPPVSFDFTVLQTNAVTIEDFCFKIGVTHSSIMDLKIVLKFTTIQGSSLSLTVLDQPPNQLDNMDENTDVFFTTYSFHTPASEMGFADQDPVSGFFYAPTLLQTFGNSNAGTWTVTVQDLKNNADVGNLASFTPIFNDPMMCGQSGAPSSSPSGSPTKAPSPTPVPPITVVLCFSGSNLVTVRGKGDIPMDSLSIGDYVLTADGSYSKVYTFLHLQREMFAEFLQISYSTTKDDKNKASSPSFIEVSPNHLLYTSEGATIAAQDIAVGDTLQGYQESPRPLYVTEIRKVQRKGVFAPATESGDLLVSGVRASNYVNLLAENKPTLISQHTIEHAFLTPLRLLCRWGCEGQHTYTDDGYGKWITFYLQMAAILDRLSPIIVALVFTVGVFPLMLVIALVEYAFGYPVLVLCTVMTLAVTKRFRSRKATMFR